MKKNLISTAIVSVLAIACTDAFAHQAGDIVIRGGLTNVAPDASSSPILAGTLDLGQALPSVGSSLTVDVDNNTQLGLNFAYFLTDNLNIEVLAATPFSHDIEIVGVGKLAETKHLPPTITANYFFLDASSKFQPYVGAGINFTVFFDESFDQGAVELVESLTQTDLGAAATVSNLSLDNSFGLSVQAGFDYELSDGLFLNASIRYIDIETEASFDISGVEDVATSGSIQTVQIDPMVYTISLGYKF